MMKKIFTNDKFFTFTAWFAALATILYVLDVYLFYDDTMLKFMNIVRLLTAICLLITYYAYKKHSKNVMKGMMGAELMTILIVAIAQLVAYPEYFVFSTFVLLITMILFVNHFVINSEHHSNPMNICINQVVSILFAVLSFVEGIMLIPSCINVFDLVVTIISCIAQPCCVFSIICIESRLDAYRTDREEAGWTEEKGYPEGYVHEHEKQKEN